MKKMFLAVLAAGLMSTSAFAGWIEGKVKFIQTIGTEVNVMIVDSNNVNYEHKIHAATADVQKTIIAMILTAQAADRNILLYEDSNVWTSVLLKQQ